MAYNFAGGGDGDQVFLMPPDPRDWLPPQHLAWAVRRAAGGLDLALFLSAYRADGQGKRAYHPRMMVALILYCYAKGIRSSRAVEMATFDDVGARVICGGLHPDHATCARFVTRHKEPLKGLLVQSLVACAREGLVRVDVMAGDGTKVKANASMAANATAEQLGLGIAELEELLQAEVAAWIEQARAADAAEDALSGGGDDAVPPAAGSRPGRPGSGRRASWPGARRRRRSWRPVSRAAASRLRRSGRSGSRSWPRRRTGWRAGPRRNWPKPRPRWPAMPSGRRRRRPGPAGGRAAAPPGPRNSSVMSAPRRRRPRGPRPGWRRRSPLPPSRRPWPARPGRMSPTWPAGSCR